MTPSEVGFASLPLDPGRAVTWTTGEVDAAAERDPSIRKARELLAERFGALDEAELTTLSSVLWLWLRVYVLHPLPFTWPPFGTLTGLPPGLRAVRMGLADGIAVLHVVEESLDSDLHPDVLQRVARESREVANADPRKTELLNVAENELRGAVEVDVSAHGAVAVGAALFAAGLAIGYVAATYEHHYRHHSHP